MSKSFIDVVKDSSRTGLGTPVETKQKTPRTILLLSEPPFGFKLHEQLVPVLIRE